MKYFDFVSTIWNDNAGFDRVTYLIQAVVWQIKKKHGNYFIKELHTGARIPVMPTSAYSALFYFRWLESKDILFIRKCAHLAPTFVDVGANVGLFTAYLYDKFEKFVLFEPTPDSYEACRAFKEMNSSKQILVQRQAVASSEGKMKFLDQGRQSSTNRLIKDVSTMAQVPGRLLEVNVTTLDKALGPGSYIVKIDVEGFEEDVFAGAIGLLARKNIKLVMFERLGRTNLERIKVALARFSYVIFFVGKDGRMTTEAADIERPLVNLFACPSEIFRSLESDARTSGVRK